MFRVAFCNYIGTIFCGESPEKVSNNVSMAENVKITSVDFVCHMVNYCYAW